jgi:hypothetical protein
MVVRYGRLIGYRVSGGFLKLAYRREKTSQPMRVIVFFCRAAVLSEFSSR